ncbi:hypothetical protein D3C80_1918720 [compost metagenome]
MSGWQGESGFFDELFVDGAEKVRVICCDIRGEAPHHSPVTADQKFLKIPLYRRRRLRLDAIAL